MFCEELDSAISEELDSIFCEELDYAISEEMDSMFCEELDASSIELELSPCKR
jgi:hypothetical protein